jgi:uncharacterized protein
MKIVVDTNVFVAAVMSADGASREILRLCMKRNLSPVIGNALFAEYEDVIGREKLFAASILTYDERQMLLDAFLSVCTWVPVYFLWRPNLRDEGDNHLFELAISANAEAIVTMNKRDFIGGQLKSDRMEILAPGELLGKLKRKS